MKRDGVAVGASPLCVAGLLSSIVGVTSASDIDMPGNCGSDIDMPGNCGSDMPGYLIDISGIRVDPPAWGPRLCDAVPNRNLP